MGIFTSIILAIILTPTVMVVLMSVVADQHKVTITCKLGFAFFTISLFIGFIIALVNGW